MAKDWLRVPLALVSGGALVILLTAGFAGGPRGMPLGGVLAGTFVSLCAIPFLRRDPSEAARELQVEQDRLDAERAEFEQQRIDVEAVRDRIREELDEQVALIEARERSLVERFAAHQELYEFPQPNRSPVPAHEQVRLSEKDRRVLEMLEQEAEAAYERIRDDVYTSDGVVDVDRIRRDIEDLIRRVARVYAPESENPLLETSFEQLARAAGRICLHALVLVEQLPVDVKDYNINRMHSYIRKGVVGYGAYQKAAPWLTYLSRGAYTGRFLAGANPLTLGAWFLATEIGKRAGAKAVSSFVDRQAIALLHNLIRVIGFEVASIYGGDFRHRDPAWVYGAELTELMRRFPVSRESLREGLKQVSALPLRSEYDRIYLYRCIADHRSAGMTLSDPALLTRAQREQLAQQLEHFFHHFVHGATDNDVKDWQEDFEQRFDMKLRLQPNGSRPEVPDRSHEAAASICVFLQSVVGLSPDQTATGMAASALWQKLDAGSRESLLAGASPPPFTPPDFDPSDPAVDSYLADLVRVVVRCSDCDPDVERLVIETGAYFRRPVDELRELIDQEYMERTVESFCEAAPVRRVPPELARVLASLCHSGAVPRFVYDDLAIESAGSSIQIPGGWLVGVDRDGEIELLVLRPGVSGQPVWQAMKPELSRVKGFLIDDCRLSGGECLAPEYPADGDLVVSGSIRGGGYARYFAPLLERFAHESP